MIYEYFDDIKVGEKKVSRSRTVTEADVVMFCMFTGNWLQIHSDAEFTKTTAFGERVVQGILVHTLIPGLFPIPDPGIIIFAYGVDRIRYLKPTRIGDTLHVESQVNRKEEKGPDRGVVDIEYHVINQKGETVQIATQRLLVARKGAKK